MPKYEDLINKDITCDINFYKLYLSTMPDNEGLQWNNVDLNDDQKYYIRLWMNEDTWPHFHIISNDGTFETALSIMEASYYFHKENMNALKDYQIDNLIKYLNSNIAEYTTRWNFICFIWKELNVYRKCYLDNIDTDSIQIPDYTILKSNPIIKYSNNFYKESL